MAITMIPANSYKSNSRVDRSVVMEMFPDKADLIAGAVHGNVDSTPRSTETITDQFIFSRGLASPLKP